MGDESQVVDQGDRSDEKVHVGHGDTLLSQLTFDPAELFRAGCIEVQDYHFLEQIGDQGEQASGVGVLVSPRMKPGQDDGRYGQASGVLEEKKRWASPPGRRM